MAFIEDTIDASMPHIFPAICKKRRRSCYAHGILGTKTFHAGPGFDQSAIEREMLRRQQRQHLWIVQQRRQKAARNVAFQQPVAVFVEHRHAPYQDVDGQSNEPAKQYVCS
jgi:hypothetical protein